MQIGVVTISDRASRGEYADKSGPAIALWLKTAISSPYDVVRETVPDGAGVGAGRAWSGSVTSCRLT